MTAIGVEQGNQGADTDPRAPAAAARGCAKVVTCASAQEVASDDRTTDEQIVDAVLAGDTAAYGELVLRHQDQLYNALVRYTGNAEDARDIAQDAFTQAYLKLGTFKRNAAFFTWLYRIAFNRATSIARKRRVRTSLDRLTEAGAPHPTDNPHAQPQEVMLAEERVALVRQAVAELAEDHRQVVVLREFNGFDYQQIAEVLQVPIGTVRSRLFRARMQIRDHLAPILGEVIGGADLDATT